ncbi:hypothetical protein [Endozoicomonas arenosclerae]|uniref:hypothetical protein n=1 Tax=Endozoicomonas arenosclerae TaxID=1633495 RepID=UPI00078668AA|nr:hypothetical protein [Endozoicomonas arenosclerae]
MELAPVQNIMSLMTQGSEKTPEPDTLAARSQKFAEEASFFFTFFKNRPLRPMPDQPLMLMLYKSKLRRKKRKVSKKDKLDNLYMRKRRNEEQENQPDEEMDDQSI